MHISPRLVKCVYSVHIDEKPPKAEPPQAKTIRKCEKQLGINNPITIQY